jgi:hypothetical protein
MSDRLHAEGHFRAPLVWASASKTDDGTPQFVLCFNVAGYGARVYLFATPKAGPYTIDKLDALGWARGTTNPMRFDPTKATAFLECRHETYQDKKRERWEMAAPLPEVADAATLEAMLVNMGLKPKPQEAAA